MIYLFNGYQEEPVNNNNGFGLNMNQGSGDAPFNNDDAGFNMNQASGGEPVYHNCP